MPRSKKKVSWGLNGLDLKSKIEHLTAADLIKQNIPFEYEAYTYPYTVKVASAYCGTCNEKNILVDKKYTPDFFLPNGLIVECKGRFTAQERKKHAAFKEQHPEEDLRMLFQYNAFISKAKGRGEKAKRYGDWCDSKGIKWATGMTIPREWLKNV